MPRLKIDDDELDDELDELEYEEGNFERYDGEIPPKDTFLRGYVKSLWWTETKSGDRMIKMLWIAANNEGDEEEYNGLPIWENYALTAGAKFKWGPFFKHFGLTIRLVKTKMYAESEDDSIGAPITKIGTFVPGEESESAWCAILTAREKNYKDSTKWDPHVAQWLDYDDEAEDEDEEDEEPEEDEELDEEEEEDEEEPPPPPSRRTRPAASGKATASTATKPAATKAAASSRASTSGRAASKPAVKDGTKSTSKASTKSVSKSSASAKSASARGTRRTAKNTAGYDEDPPF